MDNSKIQADTLKVVEKQSIKINKKTAIIIVIIIVLGVLAYFYKGLFIAALVDGSPISRLSVISELEKNSGRSLLDSLITQKLIQNEAKAKKIVVSDEEINGEIKKIEDQIVGQGGTIDAALAAQGMSIDDLKTQILFQKEIEALVAERITVTDEEVAQYITDNEISVPKGQEAATSDQIKSDLRDRKFNTEVQVLIADLKTKATIQYFVNY